MTVNERSMGSSRVKDNLIVSFALGGMNKKANPAQILAEKRKEMTESMNNQSFAGKSKTSRLVTIPFAAAADTNREVSQMMGSIDQTHKSKEAQKRQKVSISFNQSDKKPTAKAEIVITEVPPPMAVALQM